jgi:thiamine transport system permease protein
MRSAPRATLLPVVAVLGVFFLWPMGLALKAALAAPDAWRWLVDDYARHRIAGGLAQAALSLAVAVLLAVPIAGLHHRWSIRGSRLLLTVHAASFVLPVFVVVGGLRETFGAGGWTDRFLGIDVVPWAPGDPSRWRTRRTMPAS